MLLFCGKFKTFQQWKNLWKSVKILQNYRHNRVERFLRHMHINETDFAVLFNIWHYMRS